MNENKDSSELLNSLYSEYLAQFQEKFNPDFKCLADLKKTSDKIVNVYGIIISFSMPKKCGPKASNKYLTSFTIFDPSLEHPSFSISINWFFNDLLGYHSKLKVGDIVRCKKLRLQFYNDYPQLTGNVGKGSIEFFSKSISPSLGLKQTFLDSKEIEDNWEKFSILDDNISKYIDAPDPLIESLWKLGAILLNQNTLAEDKIPHTNVHKLLSLIHPSTTSTIYSSLLPHSLEPSIIESNTPSSENVINQISRDIVCMILNYDTEQDENGNEFVSLVLWDGTSNGISNVDELQISKDNKEDIFFSLHCANIYSSNSLAFLNRDSSQELKRIKESFNPESISSKLLGVSLVSSNQDQSMNHYLKRLKPGTWVRIRNLHLDSDSLDISSRPKKTFIKQDTQICVLSSFFRDIINLARNYEARIHSNSTNQVQRKRIRTEGTTYTPLALVLSTPSPGKFSCFGKVISYWPTNISSFVTKCDNRFADLGEKTYMFALTITDGTAICDLIVFHNEARHFFGDISADQFEKDPQIRNKIKNCLDKIISNQTELDMKICSYVPESHFKKPSRKKKHSKNKSSPNNAAAMGKKRLTICDTIMPF